MNSAKYVTVKPSRNAEHLIVLAITEIGKRNDQ